MQYNGIYYNIWVRSLDIIRSCDSGSTHGIKFQILANKINDSIIGSSSKL